MPVSEHPMQALAAYLPQGSFEMVVQYINKFKVHLTVTKKRKTVLGDYRHSGWGGNHRISINGNLNQYEFLITLLHELAHLLTFEQYGRKAAAHGKEWKNCYSQLLTHFVQQNLFPADVVQALQKSITNPAATASGETELLRVLRNYSEAPKKQGIITLEELPTDAIFKTEKGKLFKKGNKRRTRYECVEIKTGLLYSFSPVSEVQPVEISL
jgi:SprT protein